MKKNTINLNESQLRKIVKESVKKVLNEWTDNPIPSKEIMDDIYGERVSKEGHQDFEVRGKSGKMYRLMPSYDHITIMWAPTGYDWDNGGEFSIPRDDAWGKMIASYILAAGR